MSTTDLEHHIVAMVPGRELVAHQFPDETSARESFADLEARFGAQLNEIGAFHLKLIERDSAGGRLLLESAPLGRLDLAALEERRAKRTDDLKDFFS